MINFLRSSLVSSVLFVSVFSAGHAVASHPFRMSSEINAATIEAMGADKPVLSEEKNSPHATAQEKPGKVLEVLNADNFSYLQVQTDSGAIWLAGINVKAKAGDSIHYVENVVMDDFVSKALNRTFDKVTFVSSVSVVD